MKASGENKEKEVEVSAEKKVEKVDNKNSEDKNSKQSERTENIVALSVFAFLILIGVVFLTHGFGLISTNSVDTSARFKVPLGNAPYKGQANVTVLIIAFSDYECPFCKKGEQTINDVVAKYDGKVLYAFRNYPLIGTHSYAYNASNAALCAKEQDKFWEYHDYLFAHQDNLDSQSLKNYAVILGLDSARFNECYDIQRYKADITDDMKAGENAGVTGTPTVYINGIRIIGAQPEDVYTKIIDAELKANIPISKYQ